MAGDWIKIELTTPDKPEVIAMADALRIDQDAVVGKLFRIWAWADQNSVDGNAMKISDSFIDRLVNRKGFAAAMREVNWLSGEAGALTFSNFDRHNGSTAKGRAMENRKKAAQRERDKEGDRIAKNVPMSSGQNEGQSTGPKPGPEKRREENIQSPPYPQGEGGGRSAVVPFPGPADAGTTVRQSYPPALASSPEFIACWEQEWLPYLIDRKGGRLPAIQTTDGHLRTCLTLGSKRAVFSLRSAIEKGWAAPDENTKVQSRPSNLLIERPWNEDEPDDWKNWWRTKYPEEDFPAAERCEEMQWKELTDSRRREIWQGMREDRKARAN